MLILCPAAFKAVKAGTVMRRSVMRDTFDL
jgi:hypothetical protein